MYLRETGFFNGLVDLGTHVGLGQSTKLLKMSNDAVPRFAFVADHVEGPQGTAFNLDAHHG